ncbi:MAG TPA: peptide chain release factor N(5)-glutamine methyltransferase [Gammaproteobacteria bacterium]|nr:peptide chain release factor N(5)-glutamine methyltransferase [Gammaproteobacteria bacterium]
MGTLAEALHAAATCLSDSDSPRLDAELLLAHTLGKDRSYLRAHPDASLTPAQAAEFERLMAARARGEPVAYLTAKREFWSLELKVTPATLIPRPETELLVEQALALIPPHVDWQVADLGTGSGAIALAIAKERPRCHVTAVDVSQEALGVAQHNAHALDIDNVEFLQGDWFTPLGERRFHVIASNPPYVGDSDPHLREGDLRFEPPQALSSGADGLRDIRRIVSDAPRHLADGGHLLLEHGHGQGAAVRALLRSVGFASPRSFRDLSGLERVSVGDWANPRDPR